jgi:hypothetical protein
MPPLRAISACPAQRLSIASSVTAGLGAIVKPLADARGSDQSHDRKGVSLHG